MGLNIAGIVINNNYDYNIKNLADDLSWKITSISEITYDEAFTSNIPKEEFRVYFSKKGVIVFSDFNIIEENNHSPSANSLCFAYGETAMHFYYDYRDLNGANRVFYEAERETIMNIGGALPLELNNSPAETITLDLVSSLLGESVYDIDFASKAYSFKRVSSNPLNQYISWVKLNKRTCVDLTKFQLKSIPQEIFNFHWLEELILGFYYEQHDLPKIKACILKDIPNDISNLSRLKKLSLSGDIFGKTKPKINEFSNLKHLKNLESLALNSTNVKDLDFLISLPKLKNLQLSGIAASDFSPIETLKNLEVLYIGDNNLNEIEFLNETTTLKKINLSTNDIRSLKPLSKNKNLKEICFCKNGDHLTSDLKFLPSLNEICISGVVKFENIQDNILLSELSLEKISKTQISKLTKFKNLKTLNIDDYDNDILELPSVKSLESITIHGNFSSIIGIDNSPNLVEFYSRSSNLNEIEFPSKSKIRKLSLMHAKIVSLNKIKELEYLEELDLTNTFVESLETISNLQRLKKLSIKGSNVKSLKEIINLLTNDFQLELTHTNSPMLAKLGIKPRLFPSKLPHELIEKFNEKGIQGVVEYYT